jgi:hypothetical protein
LPGVGHSDEIMSCRSSITDLRGRAKREELLGSAEHAVRVLAQLLELGPAGEVPVSHPP